MKNKKNTFSLIGINEKNNLLIINRQLTGSIFYYYINTEEWKYICSSEIWYSSKGKNKKRKRKEK